MTQEIQINSVICMYLSICYYFVKRRPISEWIVTLDNTSLHQAKRSIKTIKKLNINVIFLPPYSPMLAPVELFFRMVKIKTRKQFHNQNVWFNDLKGRLEIFHVLEEWKKSWINNMWIQFTQKSRHSINRFK